MKKYAKAMIIFMMSLAFAISFMSYADIAKAESGSGADGSIRKTEEASITLDGKDVTTIVPEEVVGKRTEYTKYKVVLPKLGYGNKTFVIIPVEVKERGYLAFNMKGININDHVYGLISEAESDPLNEGQALDSFFIIGNFLSSDDYDVSRGADIYEPGMYMVQFYTTGVGMNQEFTFDLTFTKADNKTLEDKKPEVGAGLSGTAVSYKVKVDKAGILKIDYTGCAIDFGSSFSYGTISLLDAGKNQIGESISVSDKGSLTWEVKPGEYYVRANLKDAEYGIQRTWLPYLKTPTINNLKNKQAYVAGSAAKKSTVQIIVNKGSYKEKKYTGTASSKGKYNIDVDVLQKGDVISASVINTKGQYSRVKTSKVK